MLFVPSALTQIVPSSDFEALNFEKLELQDPLRGQARATR